MKASTTTRILSRTAMVVAACSVSGFIACAAGDFATNGSVGPFGDAGTTNDGAAPFGPADEGVILVHAAQTLAFRLCFENELQWRPQPDSTVKPQANVVGVEVGSAVRIPPFSGVPGRVFLFDEPLIRPLYPAFGAPGGPTCEQLLAASSGYSSVEIGTIEENLSTGVHVLVVHGCARQNALHTIPAAQCGADYDASTGNLAVLEKRLNGRTRRVGEGLPVEILQVSDQVGAAVTNGSTLEISYGKTSNFASPIDSITNPRFFELTSFPSLPYDEDDAGTFAEFGFRATLTVSSNADAGADDASADAGDSGANDGGSSPQPQILLEQSLADIQELSAPGELPTTFYAAASNFVLLLVGDIPSSSDDAGPDTTLRNAHLLAVPVLQPYDAGVDAAADAAADAGDGGADADADTDAGPSL